MTIRRLAIAFGFFLMLAGPGILEAQAELPDPNALASQNLTGYTHMFLAYAIAWTLILGWIVSVGRRIGRVQQELED
jgi:CcmD family protein